MVDTGWQGIERVEDGESTYVELNTYRADTVLDNRLQGRAQLLGGDILLIHPHTYIGHRRGQDR